MTGPVHVIVAEADPLSCQGLAESLSEEPDLVAHPVTESLEEALHRCRDHHPCVLLISESDLEQIDTDYFAPLADYGRGVPVLVLGTAAEPGRMVRCLRLGCMGYLSCRDSLATLKKAVRAVGAGQVWAPRKILTLLLRELLNGNSRPLLSSRERQILGLLHAGYSNVEIAGLLFISGETVRWHLRRLFAKIGARDRAAAAEFARLNRTVWRDRSSPPSPLAMQGARPSPG